jgi:TonB family protein
MLNRIVRFIACGTLLLLSTSWCSAQDDKALEQELSNHYIGKVFDTVQPYLNREVWYDQDGNITGNPTPVCENLYGRLAVTRIAVRGDEVEVEATRSGQHPPMKDGRPVWPSYASREITLRYKSSGGWNSDSFEQAFQNSLRPRGQFDPLPQGATPPPQGTDPRVLFFTNGSPVYHTGNGVTPPRGDDDRLGPKYTGTARRAHAGGRVMLRFIVNEDGSVDNVISGQPPLGFGLDEQAVRAAQQWRFTPAMLDGQPVKSDVRAETTFCLY